MYLGKVKGLESAPNYQVNFERIVGIIISTIAGLCLLGWALNIPILSAFGTNLRPMNPVGALCFLLIGISVTLSSKLPRAGTVVLLVPALCVGIVRTFSYFTGHYTSIDRLLFADKMEQSPLVAQIASTFGVVLACLSAGYLLVLVAKAGFQLAAQILAAVSALIAVFVLQLYFMGQNFSAKPNFPMAVNAAILCLLGSGLLLVRTSAVGFVKEFALRNRSSRMATNLVLMGLAACPLIGLAYNALERSSFWQEGFNQSFLVTAIFMAFTGAIWFSLKIETNRENQLEDALAYFQRILNTVPTPMFVKDSEGRYTMVNEAFLDLVGRSESEIVGKTSTEIYPGSEGLQSILHADHEVLDTGQEFRIPVTQITDGHGNLRYISVSKRPIQSLNGNSKMVVGSSTDLTERILAEQVACDATADALDLYNQAPCGYYTLDTQGRIIQINATGLSLLGFQTHEIISNVPFSDFVADDKRDEFESRFKKIASSNVVPDLETDIIRKDGSRLTVLLSTKCLRDPLDNFSGCRTTIVDLTERKAAEELLRQARDEAERSNRAKSEFLSRMSHELRTPLNAIIGFAQLLELEDQNDSVRESARIIFKSGKHLLYMINEILDLSRIESGKLSLSLEPVNAEASVREAVIMLQSLADKSQVTVSTAFQAEDEIYVLSDQQRLRQILINLLSNAIKYNSQGGQVVVRIKQNGDRVQICVEDTGRGIKPERVSELFTPFSRLGIDQDRIEGTGLGLALSAGLAQEMRGTLTYKPNFPKGSVFMINLNVATPQSELAPIQKVDNSRPIPTFEGKKTILLVEDNLSNVELIRRTLDSVTNLDLVVTTSGEEALRLVDSVSPNLILLDFNLGEISGLDVLNTLKNSHHKDIPIVVVSADATRWQIQQLKEAGAEDYLTKPLDLNRFYDVVFQILERDC